MQPLYLIYEFTIFSRTNLEFTFCFAKSLWINFVFRGIAMKSLDFSQTYYEVIIFRYSFTFWFVNLLSFHFLIREFTIFFASSLSIHWLYREFTWTSCDVSRIHFFTWSFAFLLWIHFRFRIITIDSLCLSGIRYEINVFFFAKPIWKHYFFANQLCIHYLHE